MRREWVCLPACQRDLPLRARPKRRRRCALPRALQNTVVLPMRCLRIHPHCKQSLQTDCPCERSRRRQLPNRVTVCRAATDSYPTRRDSVRRVRGCPRNKKGISVAASFCGPNRVESVALRQTGAASSGATNPSRASASPRNQGDTTGTVRWTRTGFSRRNTRHLRTVTEWQR